jgi:acyl dehydratase
MKQTREITQEMIDRYGRINGDNDIIHYDHDYAVKRGFRGTLLHGPHMSAFGAELGAKRFGKDWHYHGRLRTRWVGPVCPGDRFEVVLADDGTLEAHSGGQKAMTGSATLRNSG